MRLWVGGYEGLFKQIVLYWFSDQRSTIKTKLSCVSHENLLLSGMVRFGTKLMVKEGKLQNSVLAMYRVGQLLSFYMNYHLPSNNRLYGFA